MAMPAVKREYHNERAPGPRLRLVSKTSRSQARRRSASSRENACHLARCRRSFHVACIALILLTGIGMARVELTVRAAETSLLTNDLREDIESERIRSEILEARRTALCAPDRIESIACESMGMGAAQTVAYLEVPAESAGPGEGAAIAEASTGAGSADRIAGMLTSIMRMTAGEAQVLLVGDAGLASSR